MRIGIIGTGIMGHGMAHQLLAHDFDVRVYNRTASKADDLVEAGAERAETPREAATDVDAVITMVTDADAVKAVAEGEDGLLAGAGEDAVWLQMSTVGVGGCSRLAALAAEHDITFVDAPVLGTKKPADEGTLTVLVSGPQKAAESCAPIFDAIGRRTLFLGPEIGSASRLKLVVNAWVLELLGALAETLAIAETLDVDPAWFLETIRNGPIDAGYAHIKGASMIEGNYPAAFPLDLALKDARLILAAAKDGGLDPTLLQTLAARFDEASEEHGRDDMAAVYEAIRRESASDGASSRAGDIADED